MDIAAAGDGVHAKVKGVIELENVEETEVEIVSVEKEVEGQGRVHQGESKAKAE